MHAVHAAYAAHGHAVVPSGSALSGDAPHAPVSHVVMSG